MKVSIFLFFFCAFSMLAGNAHSQRMLPALDLKNKTISQVLSVIESESDLVFIFADETNTELEKKVNLKTGRKAVTEIMDQVFKNTDLTYKITDRQVAVYKKNKEQSSPTVTNTNSPTQKRRQVSGMVIDALTKESVVGASVWIKDTSVGVFTDMDGKYSINVSNNVAVLVFSFIGYKNQEIIVGDKTIINVELSESEATSLDEVVVVAYGQQRKESIIGAISTVSVDKLKLPSGKISNVLAGQLSGVVGITRSGEPGAGSEFYIRGVSTFGTNKTPLVLVDGIERSMDLVDPEDIETFSILKDATATAVYGVRGANGVLLITTRKGHEGKPRITVRAEAGMTAPTRLPKFINSNQWIEMYNEAYVNDNGLPFYDEEIIRKYRDGSDRELYPQVDWIETLYKDWASNQRVNVNVSGGGTMARYYVAGSIYNEGSIFREDKKATGYNSSINYNKINFRSNLDVNLTPTTVLNVNLSNVYEKKNGPGAKTSDIWGYSASTSPNAFPVQYADGKMSGPTSGTGFNPYNLLMYSGYEEQYWNNAQALVGLSQDLGSIITPGLKANMKFSWDALTFNSIKRGFTPKQYLAKGRNDNNEVIYDVVAQGQEYLGFEKSNTGDRVTYIEASLSYDRLFKDTHRVGALFLFNQKQKNDIAAGSNINSLPYRNQGVAGRVTYALYDRYFAEFNIGYNGSENFSPGKKFGVFPAGAIGWLVSNEKFWEPLQNTVNIFKLKASYGIVGNDQIGGNRRFVYEATIKESKFDSTYPDGQKVPTYIFNGDSPAIPAASLQKGEIANTNVAWEESRKTNIGIETTLFNSLRLQGDYFYEKREGIFLQRASLPDFIGISTPAWVNIGKMKNQGFDSSLEYDKKVGQVMLTGRFNFTYTHNTVLENDQPVYADKYRSGIGQRHGQYFGYQAIGFFDSQEEIDNSPPQFGTLKPGDVKYKDINGDGAITQADRIPIGYSNIPEIMYGFGATAQWNGFDVSTFFQGADKVSIQVSAGDVSFKPFSSGNLSRSAINTDVYENRWTPTNKDAKYPRLSTTNNTNNNEQSTLWLHNGGFLRLKSVELGYTLPKKLLNKTFLGSVRFYVTGMNLLTFSKFKLWDPERGSGAGNAYPPMKTVSLGVNVNI